MPSMQLIAKKSEEEIKKLFFDSDLKKAASSRGQGIVNENAHEWTEVSELRLFSKVVYYKPAGVNRHFNLGQLVKYMNNIFEDEEHCDFAIFLTPEDYKLYQKRKEMTNKPDIIIFKPAYKIRPTPEMIMAKMSEMYDMNTVENNEFLPESFTEKSTFNVAMLDKPPERTASQVSLKETDRSISSTPVPPSVSKKSKEENSRSGSPITSASVAVPGRKRKALAKDDSRSSSPGVARKEK